MVLEDVETDKVPSSPSEYTQISFALLHLLFLNDVLSQPSHLLFNYIEPTPELEHPLIQSRTNTSSEETYTFDGGDRKQSSSTVQKLFHSKLDLTCIISFIRIIVSIVFIILFLAVLFHFIPPRDGKNRSPSSLIVKQGKII
jgi:hypothetical protein